MPLHTNSYRLCGVFWSQPFSPPNVHFREVHPSLQPPVFCSLVIHPIFPPLTRLVFSSSHITFSYPPLSRFFKLPLFPAFLKMVFLSLSSSALACPARKGVFFFFFFLRVFVFIFPTNPPTTLHLSHLLPFFQYVTAFPKAVFFEHIVLDRHHNPFSSFSHLNLPGHPFFQNTSPDP